MRNFLNNSVAEHKSLPPLRWFANWVGAISSWAIMKASWLDEEENYGIKYKFYGKIYSLTWPIYYKYGSFYKIDWDMSDLRWDDYDENGVPYWENWDFKDFETGDAFRIVT